jgi:hypothetical protein
MQKPHIRVSPSKHKVQRSHYDNPHNRKRRQLLAICWLTKIFIDYFKLKIPSSMVQIDTMVASICGPTML